VIDDIAGKTLVAASTEAPKLKGGAMKSAQQLGKIIAERAQQKGIATVVFDRGGYPYHGVVKALAEASRKAGLQL
jgi:large subunit ribosomal protein L18